MKNKKTERKGARGEGERTGRTREPRKAKILKMV